MFKGTFEPKEVFYFFFFFFSSFFLKGFEDGCFPTGRENAGGQELVYDGSEQKNSLVRTLNPVRTLVSGLEQRL